jgi:hypothetical protein
MHMAVGGINGELLVVTVAIRAFCRAPSAAIFCTILTAARPVAYGLDGVAQIALSIVN